jgi:dihydroorotate dehydrogenase electron transfer subunit
MKRQETALIEANRRLQNDYFQVDFRTVSIAGDASPGQFVHVQLPAFEHHVLRRPFSIYNTDPETGRLSIIYKVVGEGTAHMSMLEAGVTADILGPLGRGYSLPEPGTSPIIVAGGYGCAATFMLAKLSPVPCTVLLGGRTQEDLLLVEEYRALGASVAVSTEDGSAGRQGLVTTLLEEVLAEKRPRPRVYACGPNAMLEAVSRIVLAHGLDAEVSLDHVMCCGVGACFACVVKLKADNPDGWEYVRTCLDGPVFQASRIYWAE